MKYFYKSCCKLDKNVLDEPEVLTCSIANKEWKVAGLKFEILEPFRRIRIVYNGFLRKINPNGQENGVEHVQFHFM